MSEAVGERIGWLLDFLEAFDAQRHPPVHDIAVYDLGIVRADDLSEAAGVQLRPGADAWLTVDFVDLPPIPDVPEALVPLVGRAETLTPLQQPSIDTPKTEQGDEFARYQQAEQWVASVWTPWSEQHRRSATSKQLHRRLFEMRERLAHDRGAVELVWGFGRLLWRPKPGVLVDHPVLTVPVEIAVDPVDQRITVSPAGPAAVESNYVANLALDDLAAFTTTRAAVDASPDGIEPWDRSALFTLVRGQARAIDHDGTALEEGVCSAAHEVVQADLSWVLYLRRPNPDYQGYLDVMRDLNRAGVELPSPFRALVVEALPTPAGGRTAQPVPSGSPSEDRPPVAVDQPLLPLPTNDEQLRILEASQHRTGVTVKGPPGTGKSHTIANIVSHYVACGKRVLVVAEKEQPLQVLRDKVPADIRDLTVAVLGSHASSRQQLEASISGIQQRVSLLNRAETDATIARLTGELAGLDQRRSHLTGELLASRAAEAERRVVKLSGKELTPSDAARFVAEHASVLGYIPDDLAMSSAPSLSPAELGELAVLYGTMGLARARQCLEDLPDPSELPSGADLAHTFALLDGHEGELQRARPELRDLARADAAEPGVFDVILTDLKQEQDWAAQCAGTWLARVEAQAADPLLASNWAEFLKAAGGEREQVLTLVKDLATHDVTVPDNPPPAAVETLRRAQVTLATKGKLGVFSGEAKDLVRGCSVDGRTPSTAGEVGVCLDAIRRNQLRRQLVTHWANQVGRVVGPALPSLNPEDHVGQGLADLERAASTLDRLDALCRRLNEVGIAAPARPTIEQLGRLSDVVVVAQARATVRAARSRLATLVRSLDSGAMRSGASPCWAEFGSALAARQTQSWDEVRRQAIGLREAAPRARRLVELHHRLAAAAPRWAAQVADDPARGGDPGDLARAWQWRQLESWVTELRKAVGPADLQPQLEELSIARRRLVAQLVAERAWRRMADAIGDRERQALNRYLIAVKQFGKTGGKYAPRKLQEIRAALRDSSGCIPVWIMTAGRALSSFRPEAVPPFDVLIIDEASQIGLEGLPLFALAKMAIVVGDEKQTSPENVGVDQQAHNNLVDRYLNSIPGHRTLFEINASLYDIAFQKFPGEIMLTEHFRCLPDIIQFSNRYVYNDRIVPLRDRPPWPGWQAVRALHVTDGYKSGRDINVPEADAVVDLIDKLCADPDYDGMDFGVVTLLGTSQSKVIWDKLYDRLGPDVMAERRIRCGEPANFQGDERDIIVLSLVAAGTADNPMARIGAFATEAAIRRINVAASRAREQMWVVHSVTPDRFPAGDLRSSLIRHCTEPRSVEAILDRLEDKCDSEFERLVLRKILKRGYRRVHVQHEVGRYRIDIVVEGPDARLAVECDGDRFHGPDEWRRDRDRQTVLERAGWTFERVRGSAFFRDPGGALEPLWARLEALGINPGENNGEASGAPPASVLGPPNLPPRPAVVVTLASPLPPPDATVMIPPPPGVPPPPSVPLPPPLLTTSPVPDPARSPAETTAVVIEPDRSAPQPEQRRRHKTAATPYVEWASRPLPELSTLSPDQLVDGLCEIVGAEGPMHAVRAYQLLIRATGGQRVGREVRRVLNQAAARGVRQGRLAQIADSISGQADKTLYLPNTEPVIVRTLGPRLLFDVPRSELNALVEMLGLEGPSHVIHRSVLETLGLTRLTDRTSAYLDECLAYRWTTEER